MWFTSEILKSQAREDENYDSDFSLSPIFSVESRSTIVESENGRSKDGGECLLSSHLTSARGSRNNKGDNQNAQQLFHQHLSLTAKLV